MKKITLDVIIKKQMKKDPEFAKQFQKELLINEVSKLIVALRKSAKLSQKQLAEKAATTQPVIARLESGKDTRIPSLDLLARIAFASNAKLHITFDRDSG